MGNMAIIIQSFVALCFLVYVGINIFIQTRHQGKLMPAIW